MGDTRAVTVTFLLGAFSESQREKASLAAGEGGRDKLQGAASSDAELSLSLSLLLSLSCIGGCEVTSWPAGKTADCWQCGRLIAANSVYAKRQGKRRAQLRTGKAVAGPGCQGRRPLVAEQTGLTAVGAALVNSGELQCRI